MPTDQAISKLWQQFELRMNMFVQVNPHAHLEGILGSLAAYRNWLQENIKQAGPIGGAKFAAWMESATRRPSDFPEAWGADLIELFDEIIIDSIKTENMQPGVVVETLDSWLEYCKKRVRKLYDLPETTFQ